MSETLTPKSIEEQFIPAPSPENRIQDINLAYEVANDSVVQGRHETLRATSEGAANFVNNGGSIEKAGKFVLDAYAEANQAVDQATELYDQPK